MGSYSKPVSDPDLKESSSESEIEMKNRTRYLSTAMVLALIGTLAAISFVPAAAGSTAVDTSASGSLIGNHFIAGAAPKQNAFIQGATENKPSSGNITVAATWCSDWTAVYCVPIGGASVTVTHQNGTTVASSQTNSMGQVVFTVNAPEVYMVTVDIENVAAFGYMAGPEYTVIQTGAGTTITVPFQYIQTFPQDS